VLLRTTTRQAMGRHNVRKYCLLSISLVLVSIQIQGQTGWTQKANMPTARVGAKAGVAGGKIYVIGG
jgi:hypothetical protein